MTDLLSPGSYLDPTVLFNSVTANILCSIIFGERFNYQDTQFLRLLNLMNEVLIILSSFYSQVRPKIPQWSGIGVGEPWEGIRCYLS